MSCVKAVAHLLLLSLLVTVASAAEPTTLSFLRATVAKAAYDAEVAFHADPLGNTDRVLHSLMDKKVCTVETLGTATLVDGTFSVDTTREVHFFAPTAAGTYTLETAERKVGFRCNGKLDGRQPPYTLFYDLYYSRLIRRVPIGFDKNLAPDLDAGLPEMESMGMRSGRALIQGEPSPLGISPTGPDLPTVTIFFVVLR